MTDYGSIVKKAEFETLDQAVEFAKLYGGWIAHNENHTTWYAAGKWGMTKIMMDIKGSCKIATWTGFAV